MSNRRTYYNVSDLHHDDLDVIVLAGETEAVAKRKIIMRRRELCKIWRMRIPAEDTRGIVRFRYVDLPEHLVVTRWRPIDSATFPGPLPAPAHMMAPPAWQSPAEPPTPPDQADELTWDGDYSESPNIGLRECEIRLLRGLRTDRAKGNRTTGGPGGFRDSLMVLVRATIGRLEAEHIDPNYIAAAGTAWTPDRRDLDDEYLRSMGWFAQLSAGQQDLVYQRSLDPPYSFRAIAARENKSATWARGKYQKAIAAARRIANKPSKSAT